jgi:hypothetical protein
MLDNLNEDFELTKGDAGHLLVIRENLSSVKPKLNTVCYIFPAG